MPTTEEMEMAYFGKSIPDVWYQDLYDEFMKLARTDALAIVDSPTVSWVSEELWEEAVYKVGDVIPSSALLDEERAQTFPAGTVLVEGGTWKVRIIADLEANDSYVFKDRLGWYEVEEFHIVYIPEPVEEVNEVDELASELMRMYLITGNANLDSSPFKTTWRAMAQYVLDNYEPKN